MSSSPTSIRRTSFATGPPPNVQEEQASELLRLKAQVAALESQIASTSSLAPNNISKEYSEYSAESDAADDDDFSSDDEDSLLASNGNSKQAVLARVPSPTPPGVLRMSSFSNTPTPPPPAETTAPVTQVLGAVDLSRVPEVDYKINPTLGTTLTVSSSTGALLEAGRVIPAGHAKITTKGRTERVETVESLESSFDDDSMRDNDEADAASASSPVRNLKTPAGVKRLKQPSMMEVDTTTNDIFSPNNISQGACLEKFGYAPGEIVNKLSHEHVINEQEDRVIRYLLARDDRRLLENLIYIENNGITKASIERFRSHLDKHLNTIMTSPAGRRRSESGNNFFGEADGDENKPPERPDTALPPKEEGESLVGTMAGSEEAEQEKPFQVILHKVLAKIALRMRELGPRNTRQKVILVGSGIYNPLHRLHLRMFYLARQFLEGHSHFEVLGGIVSPSHPTAVRQKFRQKPKEIIPPKHRLAMARAAVGDSAWLTVDPWEITRRRVLDYLSVLDHVREMVNKTFAGENIKLIMLCDGNELPKLSTSALQERGCSCLCICRPMQVDILLKQITKEWKNVAYVLEDTAILANDLERINCSSVRKDAIEGKDISKSVGKKVAGYMKKHHIAEKMAGKERWNKDDTEFDFEGEDETDRPYMTMPDSELGRSKIEREEEVLKKESGMAQHKEEFSLLF